MNRSHLRAKSAGKPSSGNGVVASLAALLQAVLRFDHPADAVVSRHFREHRNLGPRERRLLAEATYRVLRELPLARHLAQAAPKGSGSLEHKLALWALAHDTHGERLTQAEPEATRQWLAHATSLDRASLPEALRHNLPEWLAINLKDEVATDFWLLVAALNQPAPLDLRVNLLKTNRDAAAAVLRAEGIESTPTPYSPLGLRLTGHPALEKAPTFRDGLVEVQDEGSQLLALLVGARRGELVVDFCAGAGGKTLALGAAMRGAGRLYAFDVSAARMEKLKPRLVRSGLQNVTTAAIAHERDERVKRLYGKADRVLVDAPCTGLGTLRRNPDLKWRQSPQSLTELVEKQKAILASAARLLKPGGRLVYATCSLLRAECEGVADWFDAELSTELGSGIRFERDASALEPLPQALHSESGSACLRLWPHTHATDGFFACAWQRVA